MSWSALLASADHPWLDETERARRDTLRRAGDRARFVTGRVLARRAIAAELSAELAGDPAAIRLVTRCPRCGAAHGKPRLAEPHAGVEFSISHAGERVVVATSRDGAVGVDVERIRPVPELAEPASGVLAADERAALMALTPDRRDAAFMTIWTRKEAVLKATGDGLLVAMDELRVSAPHEPPEVLSWPGESHAVRLLDLDAGAGYRACVAVLTDLPLRLAIMHAPDTSAARQRVYGPPDKAN